MKLLEHAKTVLEWICTGIILIIFFWGMASFKYGRVMEGFICLGVIFVPISVSILISKIKIRKEKEKRIEWLKSKGQRIEVDFSLCQVQGSTHTVNYERMDIPAYSLSNNLHGPDSPHIPAEVPEQSWRSQSINAMDAKLFPDISHQQKSYDHSISIVVFTTMINGRKHTFRSDPVLMDKVSLDIQLALRQKGVLYINPRNKQDYYFDLEFLFEA